MFLLPKLSLEWWPWSAGVAVDGVDGGVAGSKVWWSAVVAVVWIMGSGVVLLRLGLATRVVSGWRRRARRWSGWRSEELCHREIFLCEEIDRPLAVGLWRPAILLPTAAKSWQRRRLQMVLLHEEAHIERGDLWFQWLGRVTSAMYWFHPLVWWLSRQLVELREMATDERVVDRLGGDGRGYALELVQLAEEGAKISRRVRSGQFLTTAAMAGENASALERRVRCLLADRSRSAKGRGMLQLVPMAVVSLTLLTACCGPGGKKTSVWTEDEVQLRLTADPFPGE
jgi:beta-lactamase regulating signal transducer with metallopeptidase domain